MQRTLIIMTKEPRVGRVKTRLGAQIGMVPAAWWFRHQVARLLRNVAHDPRWQTVLSVAPDAAIQSPIWPAIARWPQGDGDLGTRMHRALDRAPPGPAMLIGADVPGITPATIARAFAVLGPHDAVLGPATDGGYWLIGARNGGRTFKAGALQNVRWSTRFALDDTVRSLAPLRVGLADMLSDVDTAQDLRDAGRGR